jgi:hypothetical protein
VETVTNLTALLVRASDTGGYFAMHKVRAPASADAPLWPTGLIVDTLPRRGDFPKSLKMLTDLAVLVFGTSIALLTLRTIVGPQGNAAASGVR